jgi:hypothetical protein
MKNNFAESLNTAVFTTKYVIERNSPILYVYHYEEDGAWQFSGKEDCTDSDYKIISLEEMINNDNSILELANLPLGGEAYRENKDSNWIIRNKD